MGYAVAASGSSHRVVVTVQVPRWPEPGIQGSPLQFGFPRVSGASSVTVSSGDVHDAFGVCVRGSTELPTERLAFDVPAGVTAMLTQRMSLAAVPWVGTTLRAAGRGHDRRASGRRAGGSTASGGRSARTARGADDRSAFAADGAAGADTARNQDRRSRLDGPNARPSRDQSPGGWPAARHDAAHGDRDRSGNHRRGWSVHEARPCAAALRNVCRRGEVSRSSAKHTARFEL